MKHIRKKPEEIISNDLRKYMKERGWLTIKMHGNAIMSGIPDLYATHEKYRARWIETKNPLAYAFTKAQLHTFPLLTAHGAGVWILIASNEFEYQKLFQSPNWFRYLPIWKMRRPVEP